MRTILCPDMRCFIGSREYNVTVQTAGKIVQKQALSLLIRLFLCYFSHRMDIRCFLTGFFGQEDEQSELLLFYVTACYYSQLPIKQRMVGQSMVLIGIPRSPVLSLRSLQR